MLGDFPDAALGPLPGLLGCRATVLHALIHQFHGVLHTAPGILPCFAEGSFTLDLQLYGACWWWCWRVGEAVSVGIIAVSAFCLLPGRGFLKRALDAE